MSDLWYEARMSTGAVWESCCESLVCPVDFPFGLWEAWSAVVGQPKDFVQSNPETYEETENQRGKAPAKPFTASANHGGRSPGVTSIAGQGRPDPVQTGGPATEPEAVGRRRHRPGRADGRPAPRIDHAETEVPPIAGDHDACETVSSGFFVYWSEASPCSIFQCVLRSPAGLVGHPDIELQQRFQKFLSALGSGPCKCFAK